MKISVLIPYRNREVVAVKHCLEALAQQSYQDFEVVFLDYGSSDTVRKQVEALCSEYEKVKYFYSHTQGHFWSRAQAFNQAVYYSTGEWLVMLDMDLIIPPNLLEEALAQITPDCFLVFRVLYLPLHFEDWDSLNNNNISSYMNFSVSGNTSVGNIFVAKKHLIKIQGYDTFYRIWGEEDIDIVRKLKSTGLKEKLTNPEELPIFHQWHPHSKSLLPKGWQEAIQTHSKNKVLVAVPSSANFFEGYPVTRSEERPALRRFQQKEWKKEEKFSFTFPIERSYAQFIKKFMKLSSGEALCVLQTFSEIIPQKGSRLANLMKFGNKILERIKISYRWVEIDKTETELIYASTIANFLFYFILEMEADIGDYYFEHKGEEISFVVVKK